MSSQENIDQLNSAFWDELCGSQLAQELNVTDTSVESLKRFDDWYMNFYPYLNRHIPFATFSGKRVLEVGLGYGTVAQLLAASSAEYRGLDIAAGPVEMVNHRIRQHGLTGEAQVGSIHNAPFDDENFDAIVSIGCFHHTGSIQKAIDESFRLLKPGGVLILMVYNALSYRRWFMAPSDAAYQLLEDVTGWVPKRTTTDRDRAAYDKNVEGVGAPCTEFVSRSALKRICNRFINFSADLENATCERPFSMVSRERLLRSPLPKIAGLDLYASMVKPT